MKKLSLIILAFLAVLASCKKAPEVNLKYVDVEREVLTIGTTTATFQCDYQYIATLKSAKIYYGLSESSMSSKEMQVVSSSLYVEITGLASNTTYNYYYEFYNGYNSMQSAVKTFVTESSPVTLPTVITADVTEITAESAVCGGNVTNDGGGTVSARGVCWSISTNPTINDSLTTDGDGVGSFISNMAGLSGNTTYHVRAYATNEAGTAYGLDKTFTTLNGGGGGDAPTGAINGLFTINANGDQVYFSQGNLQYQASTNTWKFAERQTECIRTGNNNISAHYDGWIDLFGWATSGYPRNTCYHPWDTRMDGSLYGPRDNSHSLVGDYADSDWGVYNPIINGGNQTGMWRTLASYEWIYILFNRNTDSGIRFAKGTIGGICGLILLPDNWNNDIWTLNNTNLSDAGFESNELTFAQWDTLQNAGAVFLPRAGWRCGTSCDIGSYGGYYWTNTVFPMASYFGQASYIFFDMNEVGSKHISRCNGYSVRLVQDAK